MYQRSIIKDDHYYILSTITYDHLVDIINTSETKLVSGLLDNCDLKDTTLYVAISVGNTLPIELLNELTQFRSNNIYTSEIPTNIPNIHYLNILNYINNNYDKDLSLKSIASYSNLNSGYISQLFKKESGTNFNKYLSELRISKAKLLLHKSSLSIQEIAVNVGYKDYFYFLRSFKKITNRTPSEYRQKSGACC